MSNPSTPESPYTNLPLVKRFLTFIWRQAPKLTEHPTARTYVLLASKDFDTNRWQQRFYPSYTLNPDEILRAWIKQNPHQPLANLYFCPTAFRVRTRTREHACASRILQADLDHTHPYTLPTPLTPHLAWESSPGRYQALWFLTTKLPPDQHEYLNQLLYFATDADIGGHSITKVLRVPGSYSTKYDPDNPFRVRLLYQPHHTKPLPPDRLLRYLTNHYIKRYGQPPPPPSQPPPLQTYPATSADSNASRQYPQTPNQTNLPSSLHTETEQTLRQASNRQASNTADVNADADADADAIQRAYQHRFSARTRSLLRARRVRSSDDRSKCLWELENALADAGLSPQEIVTLVRGTVWNKYAGQRRELRALHAEVHKLFARRARQLSVPAQVLTQDPNVHELYGNDTDSDSSTDYPTNHQQSQTPNPSLRRARAARPILKVLRLSDFLTQPFLQPAWLVESIWGLNSHGLLAGEAKTFKSLLTMDLAVSIASGTPFLNTFQVPHKGPVLIVQEENDPSLVHDRLWRITHSRKLAPSVGGLTTSASPTSPPPNTLDLTLDFAGANLPVHLSNKDGFLLTNPKHIKALRRQVSQIRPALVILDPIYLMIPGLNENEMKDITPILHSLSKIKHDFGCGVLLVHHYKKPQANDNSVTRPGHRVSGSTVFHRWLASAIYVNATKEAQTVEIVGEHREHASGKGFRCKFDLGTHNDDLTYNPTVELLNDPHPPTEDELAKKPPAKPPKSPKPARPRRTRSKALPDPTPARPRPERPKAVRKAHTAPQAPSRTDQRHTDILDYSIRNA